MISRRTRRRELKKDLIALALIIAFALAAFGINSIGSFMAEKVIAPVMEFWGKNEKTGSYEEITAEGIEVYLSSMGSYEQRSEAESAYPQCYIIAADGVFHAIDGAYTSHDIASEKAKAGVITLKSQGAGVKLSGTPEQCRIIKDSLALFPEAIKIFTSAEMNFTLKKTRLSLLADKAESSFNELSAIKSDNETLRRLTELSSLCRALCLSCSDEAQLNQNAVILAYEYFLFLSE